MVGVDPKAKRLASSYLNISWVQHIDILPTAQEGLVQGAEITLEANLEQTPTRQVRRMRR
jgi:hypothetical protein